ncbi:MAG: FHA domain-containing protein [Deltaproteobacteria bacterium]|nr:FHA domain-containing protein [Deltaproteobacteria bacterium]
MAELFVVNGICGGTVYFLPDVPTVVGRSAECHVQIADPWISSMHALFERRGGDLWVVDLDSRNGTFVDGERVHETSVRAGMRLRFGKTEAELRAGGEVAEPRAIIQGESTVIRYLADLVGRQQPAAAPSERPGVVLPMPRRGPSDITVSARRQIQVINEIGRISTSNTSLDETLRLILRTLSASVGAEAASVLLLDERGEMVPHAVEPAGAEPRVSATVVQAALRARAGILTFDAQQDQRFSQSQSVISQGIRSCMCAPIWAENRILGALLLDRSYTEPFTAEDLELATLVGFQAAMAVDRARLADRTRAADEQKQRLLRHLAPGATAALVGLDADRDLLAPGLRSEAAVLGVALVDLAALVAARPPDEVAARVLAAQEAVRALLLEEGAAVDVRMTGGVVAVFGLLHTDPQAGERALRCAAAVRDRVTALEAERPEPRLGLCAGVEVGPVLAGNFGEVERPELRAVGAAVEAALRLAASAERGQVMAGPQMAQRAGPGFELGPPGRAGARRLVAAPR